MTNSIRVTRKYIKNVADYIEWYLSDWIDEDSLSDVMGKLLMPEVFPALVSLREMAKSEENFQDFFCMAADSVYRYGQIASKSDRQRCEELQEIVNAVGKLKKALNRDSELRDWDISLHLNQHLLNEVEKLYTVTIQKQSPNDNRIKNQFFFKVNDVLDVITDRAKALIIKPHDNRLSKKRGKSGLIAFYTNSLCTNTTSQYFKRPCYAEIASIANAVLAMDANKPITEENVRMNYKNYSKRYPTTADRKIVY